MSIASDDDFDRMVRLSEAELLSAVDRVMTAAPDLLMVGMSSLIVWDGHAASLARRQMLEERTGVPVTGGSFAVAAALEALSARRIAILSPYMPIADRHIRQFFADLGYEVVNFIGLKCPNPVSIAAVPALQLSEALDAIDRPDVDVPRAIRHQSSFHGGRRPKKSRSGANRSLQSMRSATGTGCAWLV